jgi:hypothetical protein
MSKETAKSLFMVSPFKLKQAGFYQDLLRGIVSYEALGSRIVKQIKTAQAFRRVEQVRELAIILCNIPIKEYQLIGQYYLVWCDWRESVFKTEALESLAGRTYTYNAKILLLRAAIDVYQGNLETALYFHNEALKASPTVSDYIYIKLGVAQVKGFEGFHQSALKDMESLIPIIRYAEPLRFFETLNSYATELGAVGRLYEARNISCYVLASPFAFAYPEWQQTAADLQAHTRSMVQIASPGNVFSLQPAPERVVESPPAEPAKVFSLTEWKNKMVKQPNNEPDENVDELEKSDLIVRLLELTTKDDMDEEKLRKVLKYSYKVMTGK